MNNIMLIVILCITMITLTAIIGLLYLKKKKIKLLNKV